MSIDIKNEIGEIKEEMVWMRRDLHMHPELAFKEERTASLIADRLKALGMEVKTSVGVTGVVGLLDTGKPGPTLMIRADIDALPITEQEKKSYSSRIEGSMHACGHDGHTAVAVMVASILARCRDSLSGRIKFVFQPAEEIMAGAFKMLEDGVMENPAVDMVIGFHVMNQLPVGKVGVRPGPFWASADEIELVIKGKGGHGALPHLSIDAIPIAAQVVTTLQTVVSREVSALQSAILSLGTIKGGNAFNVIADRVEIMGTVRAFDEDVRQAILSRTEEMVRSVTSAMRADYEYHHLNGCPGVVNDPQATELVRQEAIKVVGEENVVTAEPTTISDDMAHFLLAAPGCYFMVGGANRERGQDGPHHSPIFDFDEDALPIAAEVLTRTAITYLGKGQ